MRPGAALVVAVVAAAVVVVAAAVADVVGYPAAGLVAVVADSRTALKAVVVTVDL
jgi:hypothetical protein